MPAVRRFLAGLLLLTAGAASLSALAQSNPGVFSTPRYTPPPAVEPMRAQPGQAPQERRSTTEQDRGVDPSRRDERLRQRDERDERDERSAVERDTRPSQPPPPSEFQKFVELATGRMLEPFGSRFFSEVTEAGPAGSDGVPVSADYVVGPGDEIVLRAWGSIDIDYRSRVDRNGQLNLPKVGSFSVAGVKASDLEAHLRAQLSRLYTNFSLSVSLGQLRAVKVFVVGPAQRPGVYTLPSQSTLLSAAVAAGGPASNGSMRKLSLRRGGQLVSEIDIYGFLVGGDKSKDMQLAAGDVVVFHAAGPHVALTGATDAPAIYELRGEGETVAEVLRYAGGPSVLANPNRAQLERIDAARGGAARFVETFQLDPAGLRKNLRAGDILTLLAISPEFANAVTLKGHVAQPLRYPHTPGMRIRDLIPDRDALITPDFYRRKNLLVQVLEDEAGDRRIGRNGEWTDRGRRDSRDGRDYRDGGRDESGRLTVPGVRNERDTRDAPEVRELDATGRRRSAERIADLEASERAKKTPAALFDELNWDYAVVERLNKADLTTQVISFNLGRAILQGDPQHNIELLRGRRGHGVQPEGHPRAGVAPDAAGVGRR